MTDIYDIKGELIIHDINVHYRTVDMGYFADKYVCIAYSFKFEGEEIEEMANCSKKYLYFWPQEKREGFVKEQMLEVVQNHIKILRDGPILNGYYMRSGKKYQEPQEIQLPEEKPQ